MKLEEMTNAQLVNIILRKDDIETRLREEIASLEKENKRLVKKKRGKEVDNEDDNTFSFGTLALWIGYLFLTALFCLSTTAAIIFCSACGVAALIYVAFWVLPYRIAPLERSICKRLGKEGYHYEKNEGTLYVTKNDSRFLVQLADSYNRRIKHLYVLYKFRDDDFGKVNMDGWSRAANAININNTDTIFVVLEDHLCCCYQTSISNSKDFMNEFDHAYQAIGEAIEDYGKLIPYLERDYPNTAENQSSIGFR